MNIGVFERLELIETTLFGNDDVYGQNYQVEILKEHIKSLETRLRKIETDILPRLGNRMTLVDGVLTEVAEQSRDDGDMLNTLLSSVSSILQRLNDLECAVNEMRGGKPTDNRCSGCNSCLRVTEDNEIFYCDNEKCKVGIISLE